VEIAPNDRDAHFDLAEVYRGQDKLDEARVEYLAAAMIDPTKCEDVRHARSGRSRSRARRRSGRHAAPRGDARCRTAGDAVCAQPRAASPRRTEEAQQELRAFEAAQAKAMDEQRRQFRDNQQKIDEVLKTR
jgi:hypothetical protein